MVTRFVGTKQLRQDMAKITKEAQKNNERIIVMRKNQPIFELRPLSADESFIESFRQDIEMARKQAKKGEVHSQDDILRELGL